MTPTSAELRAAIEEAIRWIGLGPDAAILRAHLETFDEREKAIEKIIAEAEIAIQDLGKKEWAREDQSYGGKLELAIAAYRALVAKREGK